jgi:excisionase family DNA binding protein
MAQTKPTEWAWTVSEAAALMNCNTKTVRKLIHDGKLPAFRLGNEFRITATELRRFTSQPATERERR